jgi:hypothetical protein
LDGRYDIFSLIWITRNPAFPTYCASTLLLRQDPSDTEVYPYCKAYGGRICLQLSLNTAAVEDYLTQDRVFANTLFFTHLNQYFDIKPAKLVL